MVVGKISVLFELVFVWGDIIEGDLFDCIYVLVLNIDLL